MFCFRSYKYETVDKQLVLFARAAEKFVETVDNGATGFSEAVMGANARGHHWFSICGYDRNNKQVSD